MPPWHLSLHQCLAPATCLLALGWERYPLQISWLVRTVRYWNKRVADTTNDHNRAVVHPPPPDSRLQLGLHPGCQELLRSYSTLSQVSCSDVHFGSKEPVCPERQRCSMHIGCCSVDCRPTTLTCPGQRISMLTCLLSRSMQLRERAWTAPPSELCLSISPFGMLLSLEHHQRCCCRRRCWPRPPQTPSVSSGPRRTWL
jgi:hypothetical protein